MEREYGIGRVPADVDQAEEALARTEAQILTAQAAPKTVRAYRRCSVRGCTQNATMGASLGPACPDHYDDLSD